MEQSIISVRVDKEDKKGFENFCNKTGMNVSTAINLFIKNPSGKPKNVTPKKLKEVEDRMERGEEKFYTIEEVFEEALRQIGKK